jgi:4-hydroxy-tetrahydrodipicolinate synthase
VSEIDGGLPAGVWTALVTPFADDELRSVDWGALGELVERQIAGGVQALVPCGTTGESPTLSHEEHDQVVAFVVEKSAGRLPVIAGTGSNSTRAALRLTGRAAEVGASGALVVCPYYNRPSQRMLYHHFAELAKAATLPIVLYNVPSRTGCDLLPDTVAALRREHGNIVAIKEASGSAARVAALRDACDIAVLSGDDSLTLPMIAFGASGVISVASNVIPVHVAQYVRAALAGDFATARAGHERLHPMFRELFREPNPVPVKRALEIMCEGNGVVRGPLLPSTDETTKVLAALLADLR